MHSFDTQDDSTASPTPEGENFVVCAAVDLEPGAHRRLQLPNGDEVAVYNINGEFYAMDNSCPHRGAPLCEGALDGYIVECGLHGWQFDVRSGECMTVVERIRTYEVWEEGGLVKLRLPVECSS